jgi:transposase
MSTSNGTTSAAVRQRPPASASDDPRAQRGLRIAERHRLKPTGKLWLVPSESGGDRYKVDPEAGRCTCPDSEVRRAKCKHQWAVEHTIRREMTRTETTSRTDGKVTTTVTETVKTVKRTTYKQDWPRYNAAATTEKAAFLVLLRDLCAGIPDPPQGKGRPRLRTGDVVFSIAYKVYSGLSGRRFMSDLGDARDGGHISCAPRHSTLFRYLDMPDLTPLLRDLITASSLPLAAVETDFAVDGTGFGTSGTVTWYSRKYHHAVDNSDWIKLHLMTGVTTNIVTSVEVSGRDDHDYPFLPPLVNATARHFRLREVSGDKAYSGVGNLETIAGHGATPYIPFKANTTGDGGGSALWRRMWGFYQFERERFLEHYHKRSNVESTIGMIKTRFGGRLWSKSDTGRVNEMLAKVLAHNLVVVGQSIHELDLAPTFGTELASVQEMG